MMIKKIFQFVMALFALAIVAVLVMAIGGVVALVAPPEQHLAKNSIVAIDLSGIIMDSHEFIETLTKYRKDDKVKGFLITINSPGGVVGPSQEMFEEIKRTSKEFKKPVYAYCSGLAASGAYYAAVGADRIFTTPGCMMGSIGVIMDLVNLSELYKWAKVQRYSINTGQYKDAGAEYKPLTPQQHELFQNLLFQVLGQFKRAVAEGRKMKMEFLDQYADGRVFTGEDAVAKGFADEIGTFEDAKRALGEKVGLGKDVEVFKAKKRKGIYAFLDDGGPDSLFDSILKRGGVDAAMKQLLQPELRGQPLFILPGAAGL
jgi:protease-4